MIFRNMERRPLKALLSVTGVAFSAAILVISGFWKDAVDYMVAFQFQQSQRDDVAVTSLTPLYSELLDPRRSSEVAAPLQAASAEREGSDARLRSAQEQPNAAVADADYWKLQLSRNEKLIAGGDIPASRIDRTRAEVKRAEAVRLAAEQTAALA